MRETDVAAKERDWFMLCFAYKWLGEKKVTTKALPDFKGYKKNKTDDEALTKALWELFDKADVVAGHNARKFDVKKANARFLAHCLPPPKPYEIYDTYTALKAVAAFPSNKLDNVGNDLGIGRKLPNTGMHLWLGCISGDPQAWKTMREYNAQDVVLLEKLYLKLRGWGKHPNINIRTRDVDACPACGSKNIKRDGFRYNRTSEAQAYECLNCWKWFQGPWEKLATPIDLR